jgi:hypothetical protein
MRRTALRASPSQRDAPSPADARLVPTTRMALVAQRLIAKARIAGGAALGRSRSKPVDMAGSIYGLSWSRAIEFIVSAWNSL